MKAFSSFLLLELLSCLIAVAAIAGDASTHPDARLDLLWYREDSNTDARLAQDFKLQEMSLGPNKEITLAGVWGAPWIARVNSNGSLEWEIHPANGITAASGTYDGGVLVGSYKRGAHFLDLDPGSDFSASKYDRYGKLVWERTFGTSAHELVTDISPLGDGGALLTGFAGLKHQKLIRLNSSGRVKWERILGGEGSDSAAMVLAENAYMVVAPDDTSGRLSCWLFDPDGQSLQACGFHSLTAKPASQCCWAIHLSHDASNAVSIVSQYNDSLDAGPIELAHTNSAGKIIWRVAAQMSIGEPLAWTAMKSDITLTPERKPARLWQQHSLAVLPGGDPIVAYATPNDLSLYRFRATDGAVDRQVLVPPKRCTALYRGLHLEALDDHSVVLSAAGFVADSPAPSSTPTSNLDDRNVSCVWVARIRLQVPHRLPSARENGGGGAQQAIPGDAPLNLDVE